MRKFLQAVDYPSCKEGIRPEDIASGKFIEVNCYEELVKRISEIAFLNPHLNL